MKCVIAARKSHLARLQAVTVGEALKKIQPKLEVRYEFRESLGDINATDPLWKMPEKGVFTQDFHADLVAGRCDLVVHSWKDLPLEATPGTAVVATLPRHDARDLLLVHRDRWAQYSAALSTGQAPRLQILSSSPRRSYNLTPLLSWALPLPAGVNAHHVSFEAVRGNIPTRMRKLVEGSAHGLVLAKAALDRLLSSGDSEFAEVQREIRSYLTLCRPVVLPLSVNPTAAAQGALAIEVSDHVSPEIAALLKLIHSPETFAAVQRERKILGSYGGGCHQKIGVSVLRRPFGDVLFLRGLTDDGRVLNQRTLDPSVPYVHEKVAADKVFPLDPKQASFFVREALPTAKPEANGFWVARADAWPATWSQGASEVLWCSGLETWRKLSARGLWVTGSAESLGEHERPGLEHIVGHLDWVKLSHDEGVHKPGQFKFLPTYQLRTKTTDLPDLQGKTHFYWMSGSSFLRALELQPEIRQAHHACGPGNTRDILARALGAAHPVQVALDHGDWLRSLGLEPSGNSETIL
ncbi:MAG: hydroxymethylbilane synthase [Bdellovibrionales bacterium]|nr:hydroxymethylbilane synthase [Bdellovibrionales bacterium]